MPKLWKGNFTQLSSWHHIVPVDKYHTHRSFPAPFFSQSRLLNTSTKALGILSRHFPFLLTVMMIQNTSAIYKILKCEKAKLHYRIYIQMLILSCFYGVWYLQPSNIHSSLKRVRLDSRTKMELMFYFTFI